MKGGYRTLPAPPGPIEPFVQCSGCAQCRSGRERLWDIGVRTTVLGCSFTEHENKPQPHACGPYVAPNVRALTRAVYTHGPIAGAFRGFGVPQSIIVCEALIDELAERSGINQLEFRHRNALLAGEPTATGQVLRASCGLAQCLDGLRPAWSEAKVWVKTVNDQADRRSGALKGKRRSLGIACMWYGIGSVEGQIHGGIAQGLGMALMEEYVSGQTDNLHEYLIPTFGDIPTITTYLVEDPERLGPYGAKDVGEPA
jgi:CO/xanthine dehydrogenase Mo-binding subunit